MAKAVCGASPELKGGQAPQRGQAPSRWLARCAGDLELNQVGNRGLMSIFEERVIKTASSEDESGSTK